MAALPLELPPLSLTSVRPGYYRDEKQKLWKVERRGFHPYHPTDSMLGASITISLLKVSRLPQKATSPAPLRLLCLPKTWQQHSLILYWCTGSRFWKLVDHTKIGGREQLVLKLDFSNVNSPACSTQP
ncbi:protein TCL1B2-like isoform X2 [Mesocricetus auratus]|uniref:Protein TCL1B2-like isoform X2 n=1 Tax=Mesocricetus auratus TaxID=10036 RepID=A0ABM2X6J4_MESAU|nr:protein TCL1B2-like isoform X2 [Mesocricetus auratus]